MFTCQPTVLKRPQLNRATTRFDFDTSHAPLRTYASIGIASKRNLTTTTTASRFASYHTRLLIDHVCAASTMQFPSRAMMCDLTSPRYLESDENRTLTRIATVITHRVASPNIVRVHTRSVAISSFLSHARNAASTAGTREGGVPRWLSSRLPDMLTQPAFPRCAFYRVLSC